MNKDYKENEIVTMSLQRYEDLKSKLKEHEELMIRLYNCNKFKNDKTALVIKQDELLDILQECCFMITNEWNLSSLFNNKDLKIEVI